MSRGGALAEHSVDLVRDVLDLHAWHGAIMALVAPKRNRAQLGIPGEPLRLAFDHLSCIDRMNDWEDGRAADAGSTAAAAWPGLAW